MHWGYCSLASEIFSHIFTQGILKTREWTPSEPHLINNTHCHSHQYTFIKCWLRHCFSKCGCIILRLLFCLILIWYKVYLSFFNLDNCNLFAINWSLLDAVYFLTSPICGGHCKHHIPLDSPFNAAVTPDHVQRWALFQRINSFQWCVTNNLYTSIILISSLCNRITVPIVAFRKKRI